MVSFLPCILIPIVGIFLPGTLLAFFFLIIEADTKN